MKKIKSIVTIILIILLLMLIVFVVVRLTGVFNKSGVPATDIVYVQNIQLEDSILILGG